jgi:GAF domain-containing protein
MSEHQPTNTSPSQGARPNTYIQTWRATFARSILGIMLAFGLFALIPALFSDESAVSRISKIVYLSIYIVGLIIAIFPFSDVTRVATILLAIFALGFNELISYGILGDAGLFFYAVVVIATIMFSPRAGWVATAITLLAIFITGGAFLGGRVDIPAAQIGFAKLTDWISASGSFLMFSAVIILGIQRLQTEISEGQNQIATAYATLQEERDHLDDNVKARTADLELARQASEQRARQLEIIASVAHSVTAMQELDQLLPTICRVVSERFGFYHTGIFLIDERGEFAVLQAANSAGGQRMLQREHRLRVGTTGIVGAAAGQGKARIALDVGADAVYFNNPDLPETRSEMALPLKISNQIVGILDVQSKEVGAFKDEDIAVLSVLADQISIAIENARLFSQTRQALAESQATYEQYVKQDWGRFAHTLKHSGYTYNGIKTVPLEDTPSTPPPHALTIPIKIRGLPIGNVTIRSNDPLRAWSQDEINLAQTAAERAGLAIENFRLLTEAQRRAAKERSVGEITARISASVDVREIMQTAVQELGRVMAGSEVTVQFNRESN